MTHSTPTQHVQRIGIIGGSGLQQLPGLQDIQQVECTTAFGTPSSPLTLGTLNGVPVAFVQRHGVGHVIPPASINARANIAALRSVGCTQLLSVSAVGSLTHDAPPGSFVLIDQYIDRTIQREKTFFGPGLVGHVPFGEPVCARMRGVLAESAEASDIQARNGGTYVVMEGPQFSTRAESHLYRQWGGTVIGMTAMPEAKLAREAELCYAMIAIPTDFDCWHESHEPVNATLVAQRMADTFNLTRRLVTEAVTRLGRHAGACPCGCDRALDTAVMTAPEHRDPRMVERLLSVAPNATHLSANKE
ncbi:5'-methylthioadenosine phosphorylase [Pseudomonas chlororaphis subsp. aurantiaca]|uniref:S-methyl-5'-thioadenosine phosphorylase n=1 Tax=Pseudomonas chlororaphis TaxID=587753 RepID=UPI000F5563DF|nr:S-methyl-5'-thioadenosine phosphorylase [Pseudomonas chlororaphis]AZD25440.1 5'-methylthioadenosine phosphorylase [Pseudomonas chlororaphis subsp. aurantiaca]AZD39087.1 5'-methylthioadenosine phosphorylase [Pseudomonas chlororaphis subsp. aurantiaca]AZD45428.1 5'-methylthioadenosine phosphorylase [Pseudomonas chlororaphis subsp. aurantiaca]AZD51730.1 5'-methylthioadenosine phosphorylase [Pseudomonas chlororaphis subsp. aurantiaca]AZD57986.1 5'-methylthioadenosine phosphorylase [Pseudomonas 